MIVNAHESTANASMKAFGELIGSVTAPGKLDARTKELIILGLVISSKCEPCMDLHYKKAADMGITKEEMDEAAWCAALIGGAPVKMFYGKYMEKAIKEGK
jgi:AhpD family alkylhydroperoxidase